MRYLWLYNVYDVIDIVKGILEQKSNFKKCNTQQCVFLSKIQ